MVIQTRQDKIAKEIMKEDKDVLTALAKASLELKIDGVLQQIEWLQEDVYSLQSQLEDL